MKAAGTQTYSLYFKCPPTQQTWCPVKAYHAVGGAIVLFHRPFTPFTGVSGMHRGDQARRRTDNPAPAQEALSFLP